MNIIAISFAQFMPIVFLIIVFGLLWDFCISAVRGHFKLLRSTQTVTDIQVPIAQFKRL